MSYSFLFYYSRLQHHITAKTHNPLFRLLNPS